MTVAVIRFGGSNCDRDAVQALRSLEIDAEIVWHADGLPEDCTGIVLPGGFSYGDYLRAGAIAAHAPILAEVRQAAADGVPVLGVCNGAQIGCETSLAPGAFITNDQARFRCEHVFVRVETTHTPWTRAYEANEVLSLPIAHAEGRFVIDPDRLETLEQTDRILFRYCDADGQVTAAANPNGSTDNVAGIVGETGAAVMMPHPERATLADTGGIDGRGILQALGD
jgi:phosphoribosylformylglycinamidine synthase I